MQNGLTNGHAPGHDADLGPQRFSGVPAQFDIIVGQGEEEEQAVEINLEELQEDPAEVCAMLEAEDIEPRHWITVSLGYAKDGNIETAIDVIHRALDSVSRTNRHDKLPLFNALCWYYLFQTRTAPRTRLEPKTDSDTKTKDFYLKAATGVLNDASKFNNEYAPLHLARGVLSLLRAALISEQTEKFECLRSALRSFDASLAKSNNQNMMAWIGKARAHYSMGKFGDSLKGYQQVLERAPDLSDPDPRIGIGCCFWQLGHHDDAKGAWERALEINPHSKIANVLLGIQTLEQTSKLSPGDPQFQDLYKTAMVKYIQTAFKLDNALPLACSTFGSYFLRNKGYAQVEKLAKKAVELTDVSYIASDAWYLLARKKHYGQEPAKALDYYARADQARGGEQKGYLPAKFGSAQVQLVQGDPNGAKFRLEKIVQQTKSVEAMTLLGQIWAEDVFTGRAGSTKEELIGAQRKAIPLLENVRTAWKDPKRNIPTDTSVLLSLARLYEAESPEKALQCLLQVEQIELDDISEDVVPEDIEDDAARTAAMREHLSPHLLNNIACFYYQFERFSDAVALFETALQGSIRLSNQDPPVDTSALVASLSFNLGRAYEAAGDLEGAKRSYEQLLERNPGYLDARMRLVNVGLRQSPLGDGPVMMKELYEADSQNLDVRALYGWFIRKAKRKTADMNQDQEQRHYKHSLASIDRHDRYSLTAMGNMHMTVAREMRRESTDDREKRSRMYAKAVEFYEKALQLDPRNAYAAQGIAIALVEDKKDFSNALQIFLKAKDTIKDASVFINLGHTYIELKQFQRAIEAYESALLKSSPSDPQILACLGRAWLLRGKSEKSLPAMLSSLDCSKRALASAPTQIHFKFNVAYVQMQTTMHVHSLPETQRSSEDIANAAAGLNEAIQAFEEMSKDENAPFPKTELEQRASMGRNTMARQLERDMTAQREYEGKNADRLAKARQAREAEIARKQEEMRKVEEVAESRRQAIREERGLMAERDRELAERRREEERAKAEEMSVDEDGAGGEGGKRERKKRPSKRKKKGEVLTEGEGSDAPSASGSERPREKKKRRLVGRKEDSASKKGKGKSNGKFKSSEFIDDEDEADGGETTPAASSDGPRGGTPMDRSDDQPEPESVAMTSTTPARKKNRVIDEDEDDEAEDAAPAANGLSTGLTDEEGEE